MTVKFTINVVQKIVESEGYTLLSQKYVNSGTKIDLICPQKHNWSVTLNNFISKNQRCSTCLGKTPYDLEMVKALLEKEGYVLLTEKYQNMHQKLSMICSKGHLYSTTLTNYVGNGCRCFTCSGIKRYTIEEIQELFSKKGYQLITKEYKNAHQKLESICPKNHHTRFTMNDFISRSAGCNQCAINRPYPPNFIKEFIEKEGYSLNSEIYSPKDKIDLICPKGHIYNTTTFYNFKRGRRCPKCTGHGSSKIEKSLLNWINNIFPNAKKEKFYYDSQNGKKFLELDVYVSEIKLGIELNGLIWHCEKYKKNSDFHLNKMKIANSLGIRLLNIFEDEWKNRKNQVKNYILSVMGKNSINIGARKTDIKAVNKNEAISFLNETHIQGAAKMDVAFGLYFKNELLAIMTGNEHHRQGQENSFVLNRLAFKANVSVPGGSSKLLKALVLYAKEQGYSKLISWSDNRWSEGRVYEKMGFKLEENMRPDYSYIKRDTRISKQSCQKKNLLKKGAIGNTEKEMALSLGLYRIWDCGKKRWTMDLK